MFASIVGAIDESLRPLWTINRSNPYRRFADTPLRRAKLAIWMAGLGGHPTILAAQGGGRGTTRQRLQIHSGQHRAIVLPPAWLKRTSMTPSAPQRIVRLRRCAPRAQCAAKHPQLIGHRLPDLGIAVSEDLAIAHEHLAVFFG